MTLTHLFLVETSIAALVHVAVLMLRYRQRMASVEFAAAEPGDAERIVMFKAANLFVHVEATRFLINVGLLIIGIGVLTHHPEVLYILLSFPVFSVVGSLLLLRGPR